jgi:hypothetical protein
MAKTMKIDPAAQASSVHFVPTITFTFRAGPGIILRPQSILD